MADHPYDEAIANEPCAKAPLNPRWTFKLTVIMLVVFAVGLWGYWDATSVYPARGERYAQWAKWQYLDQAKKADSEDFGIFIRESSVASPVEELERLRSPETESRNLQDANNPSSTRNLRATMQVARRAWLEALSVVGMLDPEHTTIEAPQRELDELAAEWTSASSIPKPLHAFDLIVQWMIMGVCLTIALLMLLHMLRVRSRRYAWDPQTMALTLPSGASITPDDLDEVDKRKWDKFIVFLKVKGAHPQLGGQEVAVDTYQRLRVEDWILAMEERAFPSQEEPEPLNEERADGQDERDDQSENQDDNQ